MASVLLVLLVVMLAASADASISELQPQEQQPSNPLSSSCNELGLDTLSCAGALKKELDEIKEKCCNELGKCGKFICPTVKQVADSIPFLQGLCDNYNACSAGEWNDETVQGTSSMLECKLVNPDDKARGCKAAVEALKEKHIGCFCKMADLRRN